MKFYLTQKQLTILQEKSKLFSYLSTNLTRAYFGIGNNQFAIMLKGSQGLAKLYIDVDVPEAITVMSVEYGKWLNALSKLNFADKVLCELSTKSLKLSIAGSKDIIALSITSYGEASSEKQIFESYIENQRSSNEFISFNLNEDLSRALNITNNMFNTAGRNNAVLLTEDSVTYADRSIIVKVDLDQRLPFQKAEMHKYTAKLLTFLERFNSEVFFSSNQGGGSAGLLYWEDSNCKILLLSEACDIAIPTAEELDGITPNKKEASLICIDNKGLQEALGFFDGFYENSAWKPITMVSNGSVASLYYNHPTTEITKTLEGKHLEVKGSGDFIVASEALNKLINHTVEDGELLVSFYYDDQAPGVSCTIGDKYEIVFAKLVE